MKWCKNYSETNQTGHYLTYKKYLMCNWKETTALIPPNMDTNSIINLEIFGLIFIKWINCPSFIAHPTWPQQSATSLLTFRLSHQKDRWVKAQWDGHVKKIGGGSFYLMPVRLGWTKFKMPKKSGNYFFFFFYKVGIPSGMHLLFIIFINTGSYIYITFCLALALALFLNLFPFIILSFPSLLTCSLVTLPIVLRIMIMM